MQQNRNSVAERQTQNEYTTYKSMLFQAECVDNSSLVPLIITIQVDQDSVRTINVIGRDREDEKAKGRRKIKEREKKAPTVHTQSRVLEDKRNLDKKK
jgi:hypothetical protein